MPIFADKCKNNLGFPISIGYHFIIQSLADGWIKIMKYFSTGLMIVLLSLLSNVLAQTNEKEVKIYVTVTDEQGKPIEELKADDFLLYSEKKSLNIKSFNKIDEPMSIGFVVDTSGSMKSSERKGKDRVLWARQAILDFLLRANRENEYFVITFDDELSLLSDFTHDWIKVGRALREEQSFKPKGETRITDALYLAMEKLALGKHLKKVLILITDDGRDNKSSYRFRDLQRIAEKSNFLLYGIGILDNNSYNTYFDLDSQTNLAKLSKNTGGKVFFPYTLSETRESMLQISKELKNQYLLSFNTHSSTDKDFLKSIRVEIKKERKKLLGIASVRARDKYSLLFETEKN